MLVVASAHARACVQARVHEGVDTVGGDASFLDFFWGHLRANAGPEHGEYAWVSPCGPETNYVNCADTPIVFSSLMGDNLVYAGSLEVRGLFCGGGAGCRAATTT